MQPTFDLNDIHTPLASITIDLDTLSCYRDIHGLDPSSQSNRESGDPTYTTGLKRYLELLDEFDFEATLFVVGSDVDVPAHRSILTDAYEAGHELGNHSWSHFYDLPERSKSLQTEELEKCDRIISDLTNDTYPVGFRAPGYNIDPSVFSICDDLGYQYDSSILPSPPYYLAKNTVMAWQKVTGQPSRSSKVAFGNAFSPRQPYHPKKDNLRRNAGYRGDSPLEIPMAALPMLRAPIIGTTLPLIRKLPDELWKRIISETQRPLFQLEFHAIDFMDANDIEDTELPAHQPDLRIPWPKKRRFFYQFFEFLESHYTVVSLDQISVS